MSTTETENPTTVDEDTQETPLSEEDLSQDVPEGVDPATGEVLEDETTAEPEEETPAEVDPEPVESMPEISVEEANEEVAAAVEAAEEPEPEPAEEPKKLTVAEQRKADRAAKAAERKKAQEEKAAAKPAEKPVDDKLAAARARRDEGKKKTFAEKANEAKNAPDAKTEKSATKKATKEKPVIDDGWPVHTKTEVFAYQRPMKVYPPTHKENWFRAAETHFVWFLSEEVHGTQWVDISFDRKIREAQFWWPDAGSAKSSFRHNMVDVSSDEDALKALGFTPVFPETMEDIPGYEAPTKKK